MKSFKTGRFHLIGIIAALSAVVSSIYADGLPGEFLLSSRWRDLLSPYSSLTNPAFIADAENITSRGAFAPVMQGAFLLWELGTTIPLSNRHALGISVIGENDGQIQSATFDETNNRLVAGGQTSSNNNTFVMISYAIPIWRGLTVGANCNIANQSNFGKPLWGVGFDLGCTYRFLKHATFGSHTAGIATVNLMAPSMSSSLFDFSNAGQYSRDVRLSWNADFREKTFESGLDIDLKDFWAGKNEFRLPDDAASITKRLEWGAAWRLGTWFRQLIGGYLLLGFGEQGVDYWGLSGGAKFPIPKKAATITTLYQYNLKTEGELASSHTFYLIAEIGKKRRSADATGLIERLMEKRSTAAQARKDSIQLENDRKEREDSLQLSRLREIEGLKIEEEEKYVRITAEELAIHFASGSAELPHNGIAVLKKIAEFLITYPDHPVDIEGHTDSDPITGSLKSKYPDNMALSEARAEKVKQYFIEKEYLPESLFTAVGFGESRPVVPNTTKENKKKNRRVVIIVKK